MIASSLVQKSYSANFPAEFGGGVINLTTRSAPRDSFLTYSASISGDSETFNNLGYTYYGGKADWTGFDMPSDLAFARDTIVVGGRDGLSIWTPERKPLARWGADEPHKGAFNIHGVWLDNDNVLFLSRAASEKKDSIYRMSTDGKDLKPVIKNARFPSVSANG